MSTQMIDPALAEIRAQVWSAQVAVVRAGAVTWTGTAADAADARRTGLLAALRRCLDALDAAERVSVVARRAEERCVAGRTVPLVRAVPWR